CLSADESCNHTYLRLPVRVSTQVASHVEEWSCTISFQFPSGTGAFSPRLSVTSCGLTRGFHRPRIGCCPRPINKPGASTSQLAMSTSTPSTMALPYIDFSLSRSAFLAREIFFFSSFGKLLYLS